MWARVSFPFWLSKQQRPNLLTLTTEQRGELITPHTQESAGAKPASKENFTK